MSALAWEFSLGGAMVLTACNGEPVAPPMQRGKFIFLVRRGGDALAAGDKYLLRGKVVTDILALVAVGDEAAASDESG